MKAPSPWARYQTWFGALQPRERAIIAGAAALGILFLGYTYAIEPALIAESKSRKELADTRQQLQNEAAMEAGLRQAAQDPDAALRAQVQRLEAAFAAQNERFARIERATIPPEAMTRLLQSLLGRAPQLKLASLRSLPPEPVVLANLPAAESAEKKAAPKDGPVAAAMYKHGLQIKLQGGFNELLAYLEQLEREMPALGWGALEVRTIAYPRAEMTLTLFTLSLESAWLRI